MADIVMPRLSDTMEEGTILRWLVGDGDAVARGQELVEIETDKATMTYESDQEGVVEIVADEGSTLEVGAVIARVGDATQGAPQNATHLAPLPGARGEPRPREQARAQTPARPPSAPAGERVRASPLARRIARARGVDLRALAGSGPGGRIVKADVTGSADAGANAPPAAAPAADGGTAAPSAPARASLEGVATAKGETTSVELTRTQQAVARRMAESKATIPDFALNVDVDMEACVMLREQLRGVTKPSQAGEPAPALPTYNDMVVKAAALALREHPIANASYRDGHVELHARVNVGIAVAADGALVVPTVFDADEKSLGEIGRETRVLAERVRAGTVTPPELGGGTFTVSNLGMYGVRSFNAIINPPQAAILSVGSLEPRAVVHERELSVRATMTLVLACDHRILYGAQAAVFLARVRELLQAPAALTL
jgi:pyruvate dehydrogenase E2 component (dihydrolipoamide acetyltransferase)